MGGPERIGDASRGEFVIDLTDWPIVVVTIPRIVPVENIDLHFERVAKVTARGPFCVITDARETDPRHFSAHHREASARGYKRIHREMKDTLIAEAFVMRSAVGRGMLQAIHWVIQKPWPVRSFAELSNAIAWSYAEWGKERREPSKTG